MCPPRRVVTEGEHDRLSDGSELLFRHVHPSWLRDGEPTSQAFKPTPTDSGRLSVARGALTIAAAAFHLYTVDLKRAAAGTWAVSVAEVEEGVVGLSAHADPIEGPVPDPAHAFVDFEGRARKESETKAKLLLAAARARGRQHP